MGNLHKEINKMSSLVVAAAILTALVLTVAVIAATSSVAGVIEFRDNDFKVTVTEANSGGYEACVKTSNGIWISGLTGKSYVVITTYGVPTKSDSAVYRISLRYLGKDTADGSYVYYSDNNRRGVGDTDTSLLLPEELHSVLISCDSASFSYLFQSEDKGLAKFKSPALKKHKRYRL